MPGIHVELRQLRYFKAIADARSFVRGADHLHVAQSALSRSIAKLEEQLGRLLFIRHSGGVTLTDAGARLYQHADHVLKGMQRLTDEMAADTQEPRGLISMGAPPSMQSTLTAPVAARFIKAFPQAFLNVIQDTSLRLREGVAAGHLDVIVLSSMAPSAGLHCAPLFTAKLCLVYAATSPLHVKTHAARGSDRHPTDPVRLPRYLAAVLERSLRRFRRETHRALRSQFRGAGRRPGRAWRGRRNCTLWFHLAAKSTGLVGHTRPRPGSLVDDCHFLRTRRFDGCPATKQHAHGACATGGGHR